MIDSSKYYVRRGFFYLSYRGWLEQAGLSGVMVQGVQTW